MFSEEYGSIIGRFVLLRLMAVMLLELNHSAGPVAAAHTARICQMISSQTVIPFYIWMIQKLRKGRLSMMNFIFIYGSFVISGMCSTRKVMIPRYFLPASIEPDEQWQAAHQNKLWAGPILCEWWVGMHFIAAIPINDSVESGFLPFSSHFQECQFPPTGHGVLQSHLFQKDTELLPCRYRDIFSGSMTAWLLRERSADCPQK